MTKTQFIEKLNKELSFIPADELESRIAFYSEMIDDRMEEGLDEGSAVSAIGNIDDIIFQLKLEHSTNSTQENTDTLCDDEAFITKKNKSAPEHQKPKRSAWTIVLIAVGSPLWISLGAAAFAIIVSIYAIIWAVAGSLWSLPISLAAVGIGGIALGVVTIVHSQVLLGISLIGAAISCIGLSIFAGFGCFHLTRLTVFLSKAIARFIKFLFTGRESSHA